MKKLNLCIIVLFVFMSAVGYAAQQQAMYDVREAAFPGATGNSTLDHASKAIMEACAINRWQAQEVKPGLIVASYSLRSHEATVCIPYTPTHYSILFASGLNLSDHVRYLTGDLNKSYEEWLRELNYSIQKGYKQ